MTKATIIAFSFITSILINTCYGAELAEVEAANWIFAKNDLLENNIKVRYYEGIFCSGARDIYVSFPQEFRGAVYLSASLELSEDNEIQLFVTLTQQENSLTIYSAEPFTGVSFCLNEELMETAVVNLSYSKNGYLTDNIILRNLNELSD